MKTVAERRRQGSRSAPESRLPVFRLLSYYYYITYFFPVRTNLNQSKILSNIV